MARLRSEAGFTLVELLIVVAIFAFAMLAVVFIYMATQQSALYATAGEDAQLAARAVIQRLTADLQLINAGRPTPGTVPDGFITTATASSLTFLGDFDNSTDAAGNTITVAGVTSTDCPSADPCAPPGATSVTMTAPASGTSMSALFPCGSTFTLADGPIMETHLITSTGCVSGNTVSFAAGEALLTYYPQGATVRSVETVSYAWESSTGNLCRNEGAACPTPSATSTTAFTDSQILASGVTNFALTYLNAAGATIADTSTQTNRDTIRAILLQVSVQSRSGDQTVRRTMAVGVAPRNLR